MVVECIAMYICKINSPDVVRLVLIEFERSVKFWCENLALSYYVSGSSLEVMLIYRLILIKCSILSCDRH